MFAAPRFLAVDDKPEHLNAILDTFQRLGSPCMGLQFDAAEPLEKEAFRGVRALFLDLHLIGGAKTSDEKQHFANIASILEANISEMGGPFILILWTEHAHLAGALADYLDNSLDANLPWCRPLAVLPLAKERFINVDDGTAKAADELRKAVEDALGTNPQLAALIGWETDVLVAAGETLSSLTALVPAQDRVSARFPDALDAVLSRLAVEAVGKKHVGTDPRAAITAALAPILADRIVNQDLPQSVQDLWAKAVTRHGDKKLPNAAPAEAGGINRMLHVAIGAGETVQATDWGAVSEMPAAFWTDQAMTDLVGVDRDHLLRAEFCIHRDHHAQCRPRLVRVGATCDYAQGRPGPIPFLIGVEIPVGVPRLTGADGTFRAPAAEWSSPVFLLPGTTEPFTLHVNSRFEITRPAAACGGWTAAYRLREQLLMHLIAHTSAYVGRPGIVRL
jgi:hypothetical protein